MPRDLFGDVTDPSITLGTRKWYSVPLSFVAHTAVIGVLIVAPLVATGALPVPSSGSIVVLLTPPSLPSPPPVRRATAASVPKSNPHAAPLSAPDNITPEPTLDTGFEADTSLADVVAGATIDGAAIVVPPPPDTPKTEVPKTVRPGGVIRAPTRLNYVAPTYPAIALAARLRGMVIIEAVIDTEGRVQDARVLRSDAVLLNESALTAVRRWTYTPTLLNGVPVSVIMTVTVQFELGR
jgi:protein TonB